jgi:hypothetical protein
VKLVPGGNGPAPCLIYRYKEDITSEQKAALLEVIRSHSHYRITHEIRRELVESKSRDNEVPMEAAIGYEGSSSSRAAASVGLAPASAAPGMEF